jgi:hypothetical protein
MSTRYLREYEYKVFEISWSSVLAPKERYSLLSCEPYVPGYSGFKKHFPVESRVLGWRFGSDLISPASPAFSSEYLAGFGQGEDF